MSMGTLTLLSLPIGNIDDLTMRGLKALQEGTYFAVEDTRTFKALLKQLNISWEDKKIFSYFDHSTQKNEEVLMGILEEGAMLYLCSEAGNPLISDPAHPLVIKALANHHELKTLPGVSSMMVGLDLSGLPPYPFHFYGFFPREKEKIHQLLQKVAGLEGTHVFFEAPGRVFSTLEQMSSLFPKNQISVARELTKKFESVYRFKGEEYLQKKEEIVGKGEFVILLHVSRKDLPKEVQYSQLLGLAQELLEIGPNQKSLSKLLGEILGKPAKEIYGHWQSKKGKNLTPS